MFNERHIEDTLDDIKRIIFYYGDTIDYADYIRDLKNIIEMLNNAKSNAVNAEQCAVLEELANRAKMYLEKTEVFQCHYENQDMYENV